MAKTNGTAVIPWAFKQRFGSMGQTLADACPILSFDVVGIIASYIVCGCAKPDAQPNHLSSFGSQGQGDGQFSPHCSGIACDSLDRIWVCDRRRVQVFDSDGSFLFHSALGKVKDPVSIAIDSVHNEVFIADCRLDEMIVCGMDGRFLRRFGLTLLNDLVSLAVCVSQVVVRKHVGMAGNIQKNGWLVMSDFSNHRVQVFDRNGRWVREWGREGNGNGQFDGPKGIVCTSGGDILVCDSGNRRIQVFDENGTYLDQFSSSQLSHPHSICLGRLGQILVYDARNECVYIFKSHRTVGKSDVLYNDDATTNLITMFGEPKGAWSRKNMCVDRNGKIYIWGYDSHVHVFAFAV